MLQRLIAIGITIVGDWKTNQAECKNAVGQASESEMRRKTMLKDKDKKGGEASFLWHQHLRGNGLPVTGLILQKNIAIRRKRFRIY